VRIYNRAGGLVFEMSGYDNNLRVFDGTGNRGLYLGNKQLPAGTYYWVLFRDNVNEKPKTGFLELIR
uniref:T9SS type B sorting domain-containing protein n=1 Tax=Cesiribacter sp. SM1 TaxID=2861196 RepID=UPI001CD7E8EA